MDSRVRRLKAIWRSLTNTREPAIGLPGLGAEIKASKQSHSVREATARNSVFEVKFSGVNAADQIESKVLGLRTLYVCSNFVTYTLPLRPEPRLEEQRTPPPPGVPAPS